MLLVGRSEASTWAGGVFRCGAFIQSRQVCFWLEHPVPDRRQSMIHFIADPATNGCCRTQKICAKRESGARKGIMGRHSRPAAKSVKPVFAPQPTVGCILTLPQDQRFQKFVPVAVVTRFGEGAEIAHARRGPALSGTFESTLPFTTGRFQRVLSRWASHAGGSRCNSFVAHVRQSSPALV